MRLYAIAIGTMKAKNAGDVRTIIKTEASIESVASMKDEIEVGMTKSMESKSDENLDVIRPRSVTWKKVRGAPMTFKRSDL